MTGFLAWGAGAGDAGGGGAAGGSGGEAGWSAGGGTRAGTIGTSGVGAMGCTGGSGAGGGFTAAGARVSDTPQNGQCFTGPQSPCPQALLAHEVGNAEALADDADMVFSCALKVLAVEPGLSEEGRPRLAQTGAQAP